jgi:hypothetical protein
MRKMGNKKLPMAIVHATSACIRRCIPRKMSSDAYMIMGMAGMWARSDLSDEQAKGELEKEVPRSSRATGEALKRLSGYRDRFEFDRAYRLLDALLHQEQVQPIDDSCAGLFQREAELGRMPLGEAFSRLTTFVPGLADLQRTALVTRERPSQVSKQQTVAHLDNIRQVRRIVGPKTKHADPLIRSYISRNIALVYLGQIKRGNCVDSELPYFLRTQSRHMTR